MKQTSIYKEKALIGALLTVGSVLIIGIALCRVQAIAHIQATTTMLLQEAVKKSTIAKTANIPFSGYNHHPNSIGTLEQKTFKNADTAFVYYRKRTDIETEIKDSRQTFLLLTQDLHSKDIQLVFDSLLQQKGIHTQTAIGVTASFYKKLNDWYPKDTAKMHLDFKTSYTKQGMFEDINYYAYIDYPFFTICKAAPKHTIYTLYTLLFIELLLCGFLLIYRSKKTEEPLQAEITAIPTETVAETEENTLDAANIKLTNQSRQLLNLFLHAKEHRVKKQLIKTTFWPSKDNATGNMTTAIDRLKHSLTEAEVNYTLEVDEIDKEYYLLVPLKKEPSSF